MKKNLLKFFMSKINRAFLYISCLFFVFYSPDADCQQVKNIGIPFIKNFTPDIYKASEQNWSITQSKEGLIYVANNFGLLEFDGNTWRMIPGVSRSVCKNDDNTIFIGRNGDFGYLKSNAANNLTYKSLSKKIPGGDTIFNDIWYTHSIGKAIFFVAQSAMYIYENDTIAVIKPKTSFRSGIAVNGNYYVREAKVGLKILKNNKLELISGGELFADERPAFMLPYDKHNLLVGSRSLGMFLYDGIQFKPFKTQSDNFLQTNFISCGISLGNGYFAIGTNLGGILIIDNSGNPVQLINKERGLQNNTVWNIFLDVHKNLWAALDAGISYVEINSPFSYFNEKFGIDAKCYTALFDQNKLYIGGAPFIYTIDWTSTNNPLTIPQFSKIEKTATHTWLIKKIGSQIISAHSPDIQIIDEKDVTQIPVNNQSIYSLFEINDNPKIILAGGDDASYLLKFENNKWTVIKKFDELKSRSFEKDDQGNFWSTSQSNVFSKFKLSKNFDSIISIKNYPLESGLSQSAGTLMIFINKKIVAGTATGFVNYNSKTDRFEPYETFNKLIGKSAVNINGIDAKGNVWFTDKNGLGEFINKENEQYELYQAPFNKFGIPLSSYPVFCLNDSTVLFGQGKGFIHYNPKIKKDFEQTFSTLIRNVQLINSDSTVYYGAKTDENFVNYFAHEFNSYRFIFSATFYENVEKTAYQYWLEGFDKKWSNWSNETKKEYTNLSAGNYTFHVKSRNIYKKEGNESTYTFIIKTPWYNTVWAYFVYIILTVSFIYTIVYVNSKRLKAANIKLEKLVNDRTKEISQKNEILLTKNEEIKQQTEELLATNDALEQQKERVEKSYRTAKLVSDFGEKITSTFQIESINRMVYDYVHQEMDVFAFGIGIYNQKTEEIFYKEFIQRDKHTISIIRKVTNEDNLTAWVIINKKPLYVKNMQTEFSHYAKKMADIFSENVPSSEILIPLIVEDRIVGIMTIASLKQAAYSDQDYNFLLSLASYIAIGLDNSSAYQAVSILNATKDKFFSIIAHDLKNPIASISDLSKLFYNFFETLKKDEMYNFVTMIKEGAEHSYELLINLLDWARSQRGSIEFEPKILNVEQIIDTNIELQTATAFKKQITLCKEIDGEILSYADENMVSTIIRNLLSNALKFTPNDRQITLGACYFMSADFNKKQQVKVWVKDTGIGLRPEDLCKLFKIDVRNSDIGTSSEGKGTGLGLIMCKEFVDKNNGQIWVESELNVGTTFYFTLPCLES